jgi:hypothetical protein
MTTQSPPSFDVGEPPARSAWIALAAPGVAWALQEMVCSAMTALVCERGRPSLARGMAMAVTLAALVASGWGTAASATAVRRLSSTTPTAGGLADHPAQMVSIAGLALGVVFTLALVWAGLPLLLVSDLCTAEE